MQLAAIFLADIDAEGGVQSDQIAGAIRFLILRHPASTTV
jgi:hypothetical protein